jgi:hypothetical protein
VGVLRLQPCGGIQHLLFHFCRESLKSEAAG